MNVDAVQISIRDSLGREVNLCEGPSRVLVVPRGPSQGESLSIERQGQDVPRLRAAAMKRRGRGNLKTTYAFSVQREHACIQDARYFMFTHGASLPGQGLVTIIVRNSLGAEKRLYLEDATLSVTRHAPQGVRSTHSYTIEGGILLTAPPTEAA